MPRVAPAAMGAIVPLLHAHLRATREIVYTARALNANKMARPMPVFLGFVLDHEAELKSLGFRWKRGATPGQKSPLYADFRRALEIVLQEMRAEDMRVHVDEVEATTWEVKRLQQLKTGECGPRSLCGWESRVALTRVTLPDDAPDYERCPPVRVDETTCEPDYALLFDGVAADGAAPADGVPADGVPADGVTGVVASRSGILRFGKLVTRNDVDSGPAHCVVSKALMVANTMFCANGCDKGGKGGPKRRRRAAAPAPKRRKQAP